MVLAASGVLSNALGMLISLRLARLTRGLIETPDDLTLVSAKGLFESDKWLIKVSHSAVCEWNGKARWARRLLRSGRYVFFAGWLGVMFCILTGRTL